MADTVVDTSEIGTYQRLFDAKYRELDELLAELPAEALIWKPFEESPWHGPCGSIGWLVAHAVSSTVYLLRRAQWILGQIAWDEVDGDEGSEEFGPANHDPAYLGERIHRTQVYVSSFLDKVGECDLDKSVKHPKVDQELTVRYDIQHAIEHLSQHIGHAQLTRQLWALQAQC